MIMKKLSYLFVASMILSLVSCTAPVAQEEEKGFDISQFWTHSIGVGVMCRHLAARTKLDTVIRELQLENADLRQRLAYMEETLPEEVARRLIEYQADRLASAADPVTEAQLEEARRNSMRRQAKIFGTYDWFTDFPFVYSNSNREGKRSITFADLDRLSSNRLVLLQEGTRMIADRPLSGYGFGNDWVITPVMEVQIHVTWMRMAVKTALPVSFAATGANQISMSRLAAMMRSNQAFSKGAPMAI